MIEELRSSGDARMLAGTRLAVGFVQGLALYLLYSAYDARFWPATGGGTFAALSMIALYVPLIVTQGVGNIRRPVLIGWAVTATVLLAALAYYDIWRDWPWTTAYRTGTEEIVQEIVPSFGFVFFMGVALFIAHVLVTGGDADRRIMATYPTHFDMAWKFGVQLALSAAFVGAFWLLLWLGAELFGLIRLTFFEDIIGHTWFAIPVTALTTALALHLTDMRAGLVRGTRTLALILLSWLLPLMALFAVGFLFSLFFTGLAPLWNTRTAAGLLLASAAVLVILINATYQDGENEHHVPATFFKLAVRVAAVMLVPIVALAAYAISLRVRQYGWTDDRVASVAVTLVAAGYAVGYAAAAALPGPWMKRLEMWNFAMALVVLAILVSLFSPIADPARIAVNSQMARLESGRTPVDKFDFDFLRYRGERFWFDALTKLALSTGPHGAYIRKMAGNLLTRQTAVVTAPPTTAQIAKNISVYPKGTKLPGSLLKQKWEWGPAVPNCLLNADTVCDAFVHDLDGDGHDEVIFASSTGPNFGVGQVLTEDRPGHWEPIGTLTEPRCGATENALRTGTFAQITQLPRFRDVQVGPWVLNFTPVEPYPLKNCP
ncbi:MAG TPA: DUF4153 domain-containing protein [Rhizomicrobium sp.]|jgi:hypothetical protein|nr:DUF4153 domain-containing protein [Rhizomicrobium sp.]